MTSTTLRGGRVDEPEMPSGQVVLQPPPQIEQNEGASGVLMNAIPMLGSLGSIVLVATMGGAQSGGGSRRYIAAGMFLFATVGFIIVQIDRQRKQRAQQVTGSRTEYLRYLSNVRKVAREAADQQRRALTWNHPDPSALPSLAEERSRLWEQTATDPDFLKIRYGVNQQPLALELVPPESAPVDQVDPAAASALHRLLVVHRVQPDLPAAVDLQAFGRIEICGTEAEARGLARALVCSATAFHSPDHLVVAVLATDQTLTNWDWIKWLPHGQSAQSSDAVGPMRMVSTSLTDLAALLPADLAERPRFGADERSPVPHILLVVDGADLPPGNHVIPPDGVHGVTVLDLPSRWDELDDPFRLRLQFNEDAPRMSVLGGSDKPMMEAIRVREEPTLAKADQMDLATAEAFARRLTPLHTVTTGAVESSAFEDGTDTDFMELIALGDVHTFDPEAAWRPRPARDRLRVPIGTGDGGAMVHLDIKESAQQGMGPHGLVIGATGSGKSEFLRTLVLGLAMTHSPEQLNMVLVDFKGGATFAGMSEMPHVSAVITNLANELTLVDRMNDALSGEMVRRQELLRDAGNYASVRDYEKARAAGEALDPLPSLFVVVDEFSEMLSAKPEFIDLFVAIGRLGRSLSIHLLLASQRLEEGRLRGLESHLSYRVGLRTFSAQESRAVLGVPDAYELPGVPGLGYLKPDPTSMQRFKAAYVSGPPSGRSHVRRDEGGKIEGILPFTVSEVQKLDFAEPVSDTATPAPSESGDQDSLLDVAVQRMIGHGMAAHQVWLPPLDVPDTLDELLPDLAVVPELGLVSQEWRKLGGLVVPLGTVDRPREQRRDTLSIDLGGAAGHVAVVGGPRTGKSTLLRTILASMSLTTTPPESQFFVLDFGGGTFTPLRDLPHVSGIGTRSEPDVVRRIIAEVQGIVDRREAYFRGNNIDSIETYRTRRAAGRVDDGYGDVFLVIDGWSTLRADFDDLEAEIQQLATRGLTFGLHIVTSTARWSDYRAAMRDLFGTRLELRLGDPMDSEVDRKIAALVPTGRPGRGLVQQKLHFLGALPRIDSRPSATDLGDGVDDLVARVSAAWTGPPGPKLRLLPDEIELAAVRRQAGVDDSGEKKGGLFYLGINEKDLGPISLNPDADAHMLVLGDGQSGKSSVLRAFAQEIIRTKSPAEAQIVVVDYRRALLGEIPEEYLLNYLTSAKDTGPALTDIATYLENRIPGPDVTPDQLRNRSWWSGADVFVLVDDYDLVATSSSSPVQALHPLMAQARDVGLHLVVARRSGGASRAMYEPVIQTMRDLAMPALLLSGDPGEGPLIGNLRPAPAPAGRGRLVTRDRGVEVVQIAWAPPTI